MPFDRITSAEHIPSFASSYTSKAVSSGITPAAAAQAAENYTAQVQLLKNTNKTLDQALGGFVAHGTQPTAIYPIMACGLSEGSHSNYVVHNVALTAREVSTGMTEEQLSVTGNRTVSRKASVPELIDMKLSAAGLQSMKFYGTTREQVLESTGLNNDKLPMSEFLRVNHMQSVTQNLDITASGASGQVPPQYSPAITENYNSVFAAPEVITQTILEADWAMSDEELRIWNSMLAGTIDTNGNSAEVLTIDITGPGESRQSHANLNAPTNLMIQFDTTRESWKIPHTSIGVAFTDQAIQQASLALVQTMVSSQARGQREVNMMEAFNSLVNGDVNTSPDRKIPLKAASTFGAAGDGTITEQALWNIMYNNNRYRRINYAVMSLEDFFKVQNRTGIQQQLQVQARDGEKLTNFIQPVNIGNFSLSVYVLANPETNPLPAGGLLFFDSSQGINQYRNVQAFYTAAVNDPMYRLNAMRMDSSLGFRAANLKAFEYVNLNA